MSAISIQNLTKVYGEKRVVDNITFDIPQNAIYGLVGVNGAGKTTMIKMILGLVKPSDGNIHIFKEKMIYGNHNLHSTIGYLSDVPQFYPYMTAIEYLTLCGEIAHMKQIKEKACEILEKVGLKADKTKIGNFSLGMKQRLGVAQALLNEPKLLVCDEPTSALDPLGRKEMLDMLFSLKSTTTIIFSTHILSDIERICDNIAIINQGKLLFNGNRETLNNGYASDILCLEFAQVKDQEKFLNLEEVSTKFEYQKNGLSLYLKYKDLKYVQAELYCSLVKANLYPRKIEMIKPSLEHILMEVTKS